MGPRPHSIPDSRRPKRHVLCPGHLDRRDCHPARHHQIPRLRLPVQGATRARLWRLPGHNCFPAQRVDRSHGPVVPSAANQTVHGFRLHRSSDTFGLLLDIQRQFSHYV